MEFKGSIKSFIAGMIVPALVACSDAGPDQSQLPPDRRVAIRYSAALDIDLSSMEARPSGLYVRDIVAGDGMRADSGDIASVYYTGWLASGTEFDGNRGGPPFEAALGYGYVIQGWDQGVVGMRVGGRRTLVIPPGLGYGAEGRNRIPANSTLVFDVELVGVEDRTGNFARLGAQPLVATPCPTIVLSVNEGSLARCRGELQILR